MLTFLRKIRRSLIDSNSVSKYLVYAIGEILLVMIGILLALQMNTWNQERIDRNEERRIHTAISEKMELNQFQLEMGMERHNNVIQSANNLLAIMHDPLLTESVEQNAIDLNTITKRFLLGNSNRTNIYDELIASGQMPLLTSDVLRKNLTGLKVQMELLAGYEDLQNRFVDTQLAPFLNKNTDRLWIYTNVSNQDSSMLDNTYQIGFLDVDKRTNGNYYDAQLLQSREFSNLLFELINQTTKLIPIYERIEQNIKIIASEVRDK